MLITKILLSTCDLQIEKKKLQETSNERIKRKRNAGKGKGKIYKVRGIGDAWRRYFDKPIKKNPTKLCNLFLCACN